MRIKCPHCGERGHDEFVYHGDATVTRPDGQIPETADAPAMPAWMDYVYLRDNPAGPHRELWYHTGGCRTWLIVTRDTRSHEILGVEPAKTARSKIETGRAR